MKEINLEGLNALLAAGEKLKRLLQDTPEIVEYVRLADSDKNILPVPSDVLIRAGEAAKVLCVSNNLPLCAGTHFNAAVHAVFHTDEVLVKRS